MGKIAVLEIEKSYFTMTYKDLFSRFPQDIEQLRWRGKMFFLKLKKSYIVLLFFTVGVAAILIFSDNLGATTERIKESIDIGEDIEDIFEFLRVETVKGRQVRPGEEPVIERGEGFLSLDAIERMASYDFDEDGYVGLDDLAPGNPYAHSETDVADEDSDGYEAWQDINDRNPSVRLKGDPKIDNYPKLPEKAKILHRFLKEHPTREKVVEVLLEKNEKHNRPYHPKEIISWAKASGEIPSQKIKEWKAKYEGSRKPN
ncbi:MAG: hypothetical protein AB1797_10100 [bacterium]